MFQKIEFFMDTNLVFTFAGNLSQIFRRKTAIKIKRITRKTLMLPTMILFRRIIFWVILPALSYLCYILFNELVFFLLKTLESVLLEEFDSFRRIPNYY